MISRRGSRKRFSGIKKICKKKRDGVVSPEYEKLHHLFFVKIRVYFEKLRGKLLMIPFSVMIAVISS